MDYYGLYVYGSSFYYLSWGAMLVHLNGSLAQRRPPVQHSTFCICILSLPDTGQSDWPKHVAVWNKYFCTKVRVLCFAWLGTVDKCISIGVSLGKH